MKTDPPNDAPMGPLPRAKRRAPWRENILRNNDTGRGTRLAGMYYERSRDLPRLIALWPREVRDSRPEAALRIITKLRQALRAERRRGSAGHWSYDLERHLSLARALTGEIAFLEETRTPPSSG